MRKRIWSIIIAIMVVLLAGCGQQTSSEQDIRELVYTYEMLPCISEIKGEVSFYRMEGDTIYIYTTEWSQVEGMSDQQTGRYFYKCDADGNNLMKLPYEPDISDVEWLHSMDVSENGELILLYSCHNEETVGTKFLLRKIAEDGSIIRETDIGETVGTEELYIHYMKQDKDGNIYLLSEENIYILDQNGEFVGSLEEQRVMTSLIRTSEGEILAGFDYEGSFTLKKINTEKLAFGEIYHTKLPYYKITGLIDGAEYDFYYSDADGLYGYDLSDGTSVKVADWIRSNINTDHLRMIQVAGQDKIFVVYGSGEQQADPYGLYVLRKADPKEVKIKETVVYASLYSDAEAKARAIAFNKNQDKYQIVVKDYEQYEEPAKAMHKDLIAGGVIDIVDLSGISSDKYMAKEIFADLYDFMDKDDEIGRDDFLERALKVMETDGKLYRITPTFGLNGIVMSKEDLQPGQPLTLSRVKNMEQSGARLCYMETNASVLSRAVELNYEEYVDWKSGECCFDSKDFKAILEYAKTYPSEEEFAWDEKVKSMTSGIRDGSILSASVYNITMAELQAYEEIFEGEIRMAGFPSETYVGSALSMDREFAICADSGQKEGAWEFLKTYLEREYISSQLISDEYVGTPIRKDSMEDKIKRFTVTETCTDDFGNVIVPISYEWGYDELTLQIKPMNEEQIALYREMAESADHRYVYDDDIITMVQEEALEYFKGRISSAEAAVNIQKRVSVYMEDYK